MTHPILVTGAAGRIGGVGSLVSRLVRPEFLVVIEIVASRA
jgi:nucleoside-diphosphate-sugar epimerase